MNPRRPRRRAARGLSGLALAVCFLSAPASAASPSGSILEWLENRDDLGPGRPAMLSAVRLRFGGQALEPGGSSKPEIAVAKSILSAALRLSVSPDRAAGAAWEGWRSVLADVPPELAIQRQVAALKTLRDGRGAASAPRAGSEAGPQGAIAPRGRRHDRSGMAQTPLIPRFRAAGQDQRADDTRPAVSGPQSTRRPRLLRALRRWQGTPYEYGGDTPGVGADCSGFIRRLFRTTFELELPRTSREQFRAGRKVGSRARLRPGDLVFFDTLRRGRVDHVGVFLGDGAFAHASRTRGVVIGALGAPPFVESFVGARRVLAATLD